MGLRVGCGSGVVEVVLFRGGIAVVVVLAAIFGVLRGCRRGEESRGGAVV